MRLGDEVGDEGHRIIVDDAHEETQLTATGDGPVATCRVVEQVPVGVSVRGICPSVTTADAGVDGCVSADRFTIGDAAVRGRIRVPATVGVTAWISGVFLTGNALVSGAIWASVPAAADVRADRVIALERAAEGFAVHRQQSVETICEPDAARASRGLRAVRINAGDAIAGVGATSGGALFWGAFCAAAICIAACAVLALVTG